MKALRFLGVAILACSMLFVSCKKDKQYTITVNSNNTAWGTVTGGGTYAENATATLTATAKEGYKFVQWNDGNTTNPRTITVTADATYTATFAENAGPGPDPEESISVTFENNTWTAQAIQGVYLPSYQMYDIMASVDATGENFPIVDVCAYKTTTGSESDTYDGQDWINEVFSYLEYYKEYTLQDQAGYQYGDWWGKTASLNIAAFDATALTVSASVNAVMFSAHEAYIEEVGMDAASTTNMVVSMENIQLENYSGKASLKKSFNGKLSVK